MQDSVCISGCICHHFNLVSNFLSQQTFYTILFVYKYYVVEVHFVTHFHNAFKWRYRMFYGMFLLTWITFRLSRNQLETVSAYVMISKPWSNLYAHQVISEKLLSKEFYWRTKDHKVDRIRQLLNLQSYFPTLYNFNDR